MRFGREKALRLREIELKRRSSDKTIIEKEERKRESIDSIQSRMIEMSIQTTTETATTNSTNEGTISTKTIDRTKGKGTTTTRSVPTAT